MRKLILSMPVMATILSAQFAERNPEYRLQANDAIEVSYRYTPEFNATVTVQPDGSVGLPIAGSVRVASLTVAEAAAAIRGKAAERLRDPEISVILKDFVKPYFTLAGEVSKPGRYDLRGDTTLVEALALGGWFSKESAKHSQVLLVRKKDEEWGEVRVFNLKSAAAKRQFQEDMKLRAGDLVYVPQNMMSKVDRYFRWSAFMNLGFLLR